MQALTPQRIFGTVEENRREMVLLPRRATSRRSAVGLYHAYLNMAPAQTLKWIESGKGPRRSNRSRSRARSPMWSAAARPSGFWVDTNRETTIHGLLPPAMSQAVPEVRDGRSHRRKIAADALADYLATKQEKPAPGTAVKDEGEVYEAYESVSRASRAA